MTRTLHPALLVALLTAPLAAQDAGELDATPSDDAPSYVHPDAEDPPPARWGRGPFEVQDVYLLGLNRLSPWARSPEICGHLQLEVGLKGVWSNSYAFARNRLVVDAEVRQLITTIRFGLFDRVELGIWLPYEWRGGGTMDGFIEGFHNVFGIPDADRDEVPHDRYAASGFEKDGSFFRYDHNGYGFSDLITEARVLLYPGDRIIPAATAVMRLRWPTGRRKFDLSDGVDITIGVDASQRLGDSPLLVTGSLAYTYYAKGRVDDLELYRHRVFFSLGAEWELAEWASIVFHWWIENPREKELWDDNSNRGPLDPKAELDFANVLTYIAAGFKFEPTEGFLIEVGMLENIIDPEVTADFSLLFNVTWRI